MWYALALPYPTYHAIPYPLNNPSLPSSTLLYPTYPTLLTLPYPALPHPSLRAGAGTCPAFFIKVVWKKRGTTSPRRYPSSPGAAPRRRRISSSSPVGLTAQASAASSALSCRLSSTRSATVRRRECSRRTPSPFCRETG